MNKILIIEDDADLQEGLRFSFESDNYDVTAVSTTKSAIKSIKQNMYDAVIMDCRLPDGNGFDLCREVRRLSLVPILMLTAMDTELAEINALENGADDYMSKPFSLSVLKLRVKKIMRQSDNKSITSNGITINLSSCRVSNGDGEIDLSSVEFKLLVYLMENKGQVLSKEQILNHIWDIQGQYVDENIVSVNIRRLRLKLEKEPSSPSMIKTVHGIGYIWEEVCL